jgi:tetratricopeptide (TPR) repeat protein
LLSQRGRRREAQSARALIAEGNKAYQAGGHSEALDLYRKAASAAPDRTEIEFNKGAALYKAGEYKDAAEAFAKAAEASSNPALISRSKYNLGNCAVRQSQLEAENDLDSAIAACRESLSCYLSSLIANPDFKEAEDNFEAARAYLRRLREEKKNREDQKQQEDNSGESDESGGSDESDESGTSGTSGTSGRSDGSDGRRGNALDQPQGASQMRQATALYRRGGSQRQAGGFSQQSAGASASQSFSFHIMFSQGTPGTAFQNAFPGGHEGSALPELAQILSERPNDILEEERQHRQMRQQWLRQYDAPSVEKDW